MIERHRAAGRRYGRGCVALYARPCDGGRRSRSLTMRADPQCCLRSPADRFASSSTPQREGRGTEAATRYPLVCKFAVEQMLGTALGSLTRRLSGAPNVKVGSQPTFGALRSRRHEYHHTPLQPVVRLPHAQRLRSCLGPLAPTVSSISVLNEGPH